MKVMILVLLLSSAIVANTEDNSKYESSYETNVDIKNSGFRIVTTLISSGEIEIFPSKSGLSYKVTKTITGVTKSEAENIFSLINVSHELKRNRVIIKSKISKKESDKISKLLNDNSLKTDIKINLPENLLVHVSSLKGSVKIMNVRGDFKVSTMNGDVDVRSLNGSLLATVLDGDLNCMGVEGDVTIKMYKGLLNISGVNGKIKVDHNSGRIVASNIVGDVDISNTSGDVKISKTKGHMKLSSLKGRIKVKSSRGSINATTQKGSIELTNVSFEKEDKVRLISVEGDLRAQLPNSLSGEVSAKTSEGYVRNYFMVKTSSGKEIGWMKKARVLLGKINSDLKGSNNLFFETVRGDITLSKREK